MDAKEIAHGLTHKRDGNYRTPKEAEIAADLAAAGREARREALQQVTGLICADCAGLTRWEAKPQYDGHGWYHKMGGSGNGLKKSRCEAYAIHALLAETAPESAS